MYFYINKIFFLYTNNWIEIFLFLTPDDVGRVAQSV
jgi:hypothetical protein